MHGSNPGRIGRTLRSILLKLQRITISRGKFGRVIRRHLEKNAIFHWLQLNYKLSVYRYIHKFYKMNIFRRFRFLLNFLTVLGFCFEKYLFSAKQSRLINDKFIQPIMSQVSVTQNFDEMIIEIEWKNLSNSEELLKQIYSSDKYSRGARILRTAWKMISSVLFWLFDSLLKPICICFLYF